MMDDNNNLSEMLKLLGDIYVNKMPFNRLLDVQIDALTPTDVRVRVDMRQELIGNFMRGILHGGVISSILDLTGGLIASVELLKQIENSPPDKIVKRLTRIGTIDMRVDFLRAGKGDFFTATGSILRQGNKVSVIRTEFCNDQNLLIAAGTGTYLVG